MADHSVPPCRILAAALLSVGSQASAADDEVARPKLCNITIEALHRAMEDGSTSPTAVANWTLNAVDRLDRSGRRLASTPFVNRDIVADAAALETGWAGKTKPPLYGVTVNIKDMFDVAGLPTSLGEKTLAEQPITADSLVVRRLRAAGGLIVGKGSVNAGRSPWLSGFHWGGLTVNPYNESWDPQGSSTGTAVSVASGQAIGGVGEETTDSLRGVADANGLVTVRPTFGRVPTDGMFPFAVDRDVAGSLGRTVADAAIILNVMAGCHERGDNCAAPSALPLAGLRLGVPRAYVGKAALPEDARQLPFDPEVLAVFGSAVALLKAQGAEVFELDGPSLTPTDERLPLTDPHYEALGFPSLDMVGFNALYETASARALAAYFAKRSGGQESFDTLLATLDADTRPESAFLRTDVMNWRRQAAAEDTPERKAIRRQYEAALDNLYKRQVQHVAKQHRLDAFLFPTAFRPVMTVVGAVRDELYDDGENVLAMAPSDFGLPAVTVPMGFTRDGRPMTLTLMGDRNQDDRIVAIARAYEDASRAYRPPAGLCDTLAP